MEVILLEDVEKLGTRGQIVKVAGGYGRNFLLPKKLAIAATTQNKKWVEQQRVKFLKLSAKEKGEAEDLATIMQGVSVKFTRKAGEHGTLFGSVTAIDIAEKLAEQGYQMDRRKIQLPTPLKLVGEYDVPIKLHREVSAIIKVKVESDAPVAPAAAPPAAPATAAEPAAPAPPAAEK
ncbi:MAG TPA: 50S ribosomal protein L9 [Terriglobia bacterium]|nr:50S ribosomal protein L9 [Terriglobia bacterium]